MADDNDSLALLAAVGLFLLLFLSPGKPALASPDAPEVPVDERPAVARPPSSTFETDVFLAREGLYMGGRIVGKSYEGARELVIVGPFSVDDMKRVFRGHRKVVLMVTGDARTGDYKNLREALEKLGVPWGEVLW